MIAFVGMSKPKKYVNRSGWVTAGTKLNKPIPYNPT